jgi:hypothetical protein
MFSGFIIADAFSELLRRNMAKKHRIAAIGSFQLRVLFESKLELPLAFNRNIADSRQYCALENSQILGFVGDFPIFFGFYHCALFLARTRTGSIQTICKFQPE